MTTQDALRILQRIALAIENLAPEPPPRIDVKSHDAYIWDRTKQDLIPAQHPHHQDIRLLIGVDQQRQQLLDNTLQFARGYSANNVLLWGARGMGKSSLVKAVHAETLRQLPGSVALIEIPREDIASLPQLMRILSGWVVRRFILFCDDLSFDEGEASYKSLKTALEGGIEGRPAHILFYATSNRRHLMPRSMTENLDGDAINPSEASEEKISLSDRFGLWLGFHSCDQETYLTMVSNYLTHHRLPAEGAGNAALEWAKTRGARSGRVAWQFTLDWAGKHGKKLL